MEMDVWVAVRERLSKERKKVMKVENNGARQRLRKFLNKAGKNIPAWLDRSARSVWEKTNTILHSPPVTSTPVQQPRSRVRAESREEVGQSLGGGGVLEESEEMGERVWGNKRKNRRKVRKKILPQEDLFKINPSYEICP